jgi:GDPmannose 4,6-dehydratase
MLVTVNPIPGSYYNIGGTFSCTVEDMLKHLISISTMRDNIRVETEQARLRPLDADLQVPDTAKFRNHTGWQPEIPFEKTMQDLLDYWRERVKSGTSRLVR